MVVIPLLFLLADRFSGGGLGWRASFRGRPIFYAAPVILLAGWWLGFLPAALAWVLWRSFGWAPGKMDPRTPKELGLTFLRHCIPLVACPWSPWLVLFPFGATALAFWLAREADKGRERNAVTELARGALYGALVAL